MPHVHHNNLDIHYQTNGSCSDPPIILISSLGTDHSMWNAVVYSLSADYFVITLDHRGHGLTTCSSEDYRVSDLAGDVLAVVDTVNIQSFNVCGISLGGIIGLWLALNQPRRITRLIAANTSPYIGPSDAWQQRADLVRQQGMSAICDMVLERFLSAPFRRAEPERIEAIKKIFLSIDAGGYAGCCAALRDFDIRDKLDLIKLPTLVVSGTLDIATPTKGHSDLLAKNMPEAELLELEAGHISAFERPEDFARIVKKFLAIN